MFSNTKKLKYNLNEEVIGHINDKKLFNFFKYIDNYINEKDDEIDYETD